MGGLDISPSIYENYSKGDKIPRLEKLKGSHQFDSTD